MTYNLTREGYQIAGAISGEEALRTARRKSFDLVVLDLMLPGIDELEVARRLKSDAYDQIKKAMGDHPDKIGYLINLLLISRHLERLGDHATNIAEQVVYLVEGEIIRHVHRERS